MNAGNKKHTQHAPSAKTECGYLNGWIKKRSHTQKSHPKVVNPTDIAGERKKKKKKKKEPMLTPREKSPSLEAQKRIKPMMQDSKPITLPTELFCPSPLSHSSPSHYPLSYSAPLPSPTKPITLPTELFRPSPLSHSSPSHYPLSYSAPLPSPTQAHHTTH